MTYNLTHDQLQKALPKNKEIAEWLPLINKYFNKYEINTDLRAAAWLAQMAHESSQLTVLEENLYYSAAQLKKVFGKYFRDKNPADYAKKPEKIANLVYGGRMGNNQPGDGYRFRGTGIIQYTGRYNHETYGKSIGKTAEEANAYIRTKEGAVDSACFYWVKIASLNDEADRGDMVRITKLINGGDNGLADRIAYYKKILPILKSVDNEKVDGAKTPDKDSGAKTPDKDTGAKVPDKATKHESHLVAQRGDRNDIVKKIQKHLGFTGRGVDGIFGIATQLAVTKYQRLKGLPATGIVDQETYNYMV